MLQRLRCGPKTAVFWILLTLSPSLILTARGLAYILPAKQMIQFMSDNFSGFKTLMITRSVRILAEEEEKQPLVPNLPKDRSG
jgi:hypothetical protein